MGPVGLCFNCPEYIIAANLLSSDLKLKEHMRDLSNKLGLFMVSVSVGVYQLDGFLGFHMDLLTTTRRRAKGREGFCQGF